LRMISISGGFSIQIGKDELAVTGDTSGHTSGTWQRGGRELVTALFVSGVICAIAFVRIRVGVGANGVPWGALLICASAPLVFALRAFHPEGQYLRCTRVSVEIPSGFLRKPQRFRIFPAADISDVQYLPQFLPGLSLPSRICIVAKGRRFFCLHGLMRTEAQQILNELERLGYRVTRPVANS
jgi:hypothetical protein